MKGIELPALTEDFTADPVELFFDLAYVFAFSQLVGLLISNPTWAGIGRAALLFGLLEHRPIATIAAIITHEDAADNGAGPPSGN